MNHVIFCIIGASGVGKDSVTQKLSEIDSLLKVSIPVTTRPMRDGEINGLDYQFITNEGFENMIEKNRLIEHRDYLVKDIDGNDTIWKYGHTYPTYKYSVMIGSLEMVKIIHREFPEIELITILLYLDPSERLIRILNRELAYKYPNIHEVSRRFFKDEEDYNIEKLKSYYDTEPKLKLFTFKNENLDKVSNKIFTDVIFPKFMKELID